MRNLYLGCFSSLTTNCRIQFADSICEPASFLLLRTSTFWPISNLFVQFSGAVATIRDVLCEFAIATSNSIAKLILNAIGSSSGDSTANLGLIPKSILKGDYPSVPDRVRYPPNISPRYSSQTRPLLLTNTFWTVRFSVPTILSTLAFSLGL